MVRCTQPVFLRASTRRGDEAWLVLASLVLTFAIGACGSPEPIPPEPEPVRVDLEITDTGTTGLGPDSVALTAEGTEIAGTGRIAVPTSCYELFPNLAADGQDIAVTLTASPTREACPDEIVVLVYALRVRGLAPGTYVTRTFHAIEDSPANLVAVDTLTLR